MSEELTELAATFEPNVASTTQYLTFLVGKERLAVEILEVKELIEITHMTKVPMMTDFIRGVINLRGSVIPVVDLSARLGHSVSTLTKTSCILLVETEHDGESLAVGLLVDEVNEIVDIDEQSILPPPDFGAEIRVDFIKSMGRIDEEFITLLALERVLLVAELAVMEPLSSNLDIKRLPDSQDVQPAAI